MGKSYYDILELQQNASQNEVKAAYRKLAKKYHPDLYTNAPEAEKKKAEARIKEINQAYSVLSDPQKKQIYDTYGTEDVGAQGGGQGGFDFGGGGFGGFGGFDFDDILSSIFGGGFGGGTSSSSGTRANSAERGSDIRAVLEVRLDEVAKGVEKVVSLKRMENCQSCHGTGAEGGTAYKTCDRCGGSGQVRQKQRTPFGEFNVTSHCSECGGTGKIITKRCSTCQGRQRVQKVSKLNISIPKGIQDGQVITYRNEGSAGRNGGPRGNLVVEIRVLKHDLFVRKGSDLFVDVPISFFEAILGTSITIPTFNGAYKLKIPEGTQPEQVFVAKGYGIKKMNAIGYGDLHIKIVVEMPSKLTEEQKKQIGNMSPNFAKAQFPKREGFLNKQSNK